jgi:glycosyltransferase involved in cell wall biosynthesis
LEWANKYSGRNFPDSNVHLLGYDKNPELNVHLSWTEFCAQKLIPEDKLYIFFSGTFCDSYDFGPISSAAQFFESRNIALYHFIVAGEGELDQHVRDSLKTFANVSMVGWLNESELRLCLSNVHVGLAPYDRTALMSLPNKLFEYLAYGLPIVSSLRGELADVIEKNLVGENYDPNSNKSLADAILKVTLSKEVYDAYRTLARRLYQDRYATDVIYKSFVEQLESLGDKQ